MDLLSPLNSSLRPLKTNEAPHSPAYPGGTENQGILLEVYDIIDVFVF